MEEYSLYSRQVVYAPTKVRNFKQITTMFDYNRNDDGLFMHLQR